MECKFSSLILNHGFSCCLLIDSKQFATCNRSNLTGLDDAEAAALGITAGKTNMLYTQPGTTMRFKAPAGYKFGKMLFYTYRNSNFLVGDEYEETYSYEYNGTSFPQKLKVWKPDSPHKNSYNYSIWEGDAKNILFNYPYFSVVFVRADIRLVSDGSAGINNLRADGTDVEKTYTLDGRDVNKTNGLHKGVYIQKGKKVIVK